MRARDFGENILDVACGNLRFESFLQQEFCDKHFDFICVDNCIDLACKEHVVAAGMTDCMKFIETDIIECLLNDKPIVPLACGSGTLDLIVSFGFMHHIPGSALRMSYIKQLLELAKPECFVAISFWRFADDPRFLDKARREHSSAIEYLKSKDIYSEICDLELECGDYLLGWNNKSATFRYCHSFSNEEIESIIDMSESCSASLVHRFRADGRSGDANEYLVFQKLP